MILLRRTLWPCLALLAAAANLSVPPRALAGSITLTNQAQDPAPTDGATFYTGSLVVSNGDLSVSNASIRGGYFMFPGALLTGYAGLGTIVAGVQANGIPLVPFSSASAPGVMRDPGTLTMTPGPIVTGGSTLTSPTNTGTLPTSNSGTTGYSFTGNLPMNYNGLLTSGGSGNLTISGNGTTIGDASGRLTLTDPNIGTGGLTITGNGAGTLQLTGISDINNFGPPASITVAGNPGTTGTAVIVGTATGNTSTTGNLTFTGNTGSNAIVVTGTTGANTLINNSGVINLNAGSLMFTKGTGTAVLTLHLGNAAVVPINIAATLNTDDPGTAFSDTNTVASIADTGAAFPVGSSIKVTAETAGTVPPNATLHALVGYTGTIVNQTGVDLIITPSTDEPGGLLITRP